MKKYMSPTESVRTRPASRRPGEEVGPEDPHRIDVGLEEVLEPRAAGGCLLLDHPEERRTSPPTSTNFTTRRAG